MGARKGQNNFERLQKAKIKANERLITTVLKFVPKGMVFTDENALIIYAAKMAGLHRTTIKRTPEYMKLLLKYFSEQPGGAGLVDDEDANAAQLSVKLIAARVRIRSLEEDVARLEKALGCSHDQIASLGLTQHMLSTDKERKETIYDLAFVNTAMTLLALLECVFKKEIGIVIDKHVRQILDTTEFGDERIIAGPERSKYFFEWLTSQPLLNATRASRM
jgi:hypothetical protein